MVMIVYTQRNSQEFTNFYRLKHSVAFMYALSMKIMSHVTISHEYNLENIHLSSCGRLYYGVKDEVDFLKALTKVLYLKGCNQKFCWKFLLKLESDLIH
jgi:hypothetical protein